MAASVATNVVIISGCGGLFVFSEILPPFAHPAITKEPLACGVDVTRQVQEFELMPLGLGQAIEWGRGVSFSADGIHDFLARGLDSFDSPRT